MFGIAKTFNYIIYNTIWNTMQHVSTCTKQRKRNTTGLIESVLKLLSYKIDLQLILIVFRTYTDFSYIFGVSDSKCFNLGQISIVF